AIEFIFNHFQTRNTTCKTEITNARPFYKWNTDVLLHDIYKHLLRYPIIQVYWEIMCEFIVPYKRTIGVERNNLPKSGDLDIEFIKNQKPKFNPLLYECDLHKIKVINGT
ncbi:hypothetical protein RFI_01786, partial [Reticulomyxa filosa]